MDRAYIISAPDGSQGVWTTRGFRFVPAPTGEYPRLLAMGFTKEEIDPLVVQAEAEGVRDVEGYVMRSLIR